MKYRFDIKTLVVQLDSKQYLHSECRGFKPLHAHMWERVNGRVGVPHGRRPLVFRVDFARYELKMGNLKNFMEYPV